MNYFVMYSGCLTPLSTILQLCCGCQFYVSGGIEPKDYTHTHTHCI